MLEIIGLDRLMMMPNTLDCGLNLFTFASVVSAFTGTLFSWKSSDSRNSNTVLADTKGGIFNLEKKIYQDSLFCPTRSCFVVFLNTHFHIQINKR